MLTFEEQTLCTCFQERGSKNQKPVHGSNRPRRDNVDRFLKVLGKIFDSLSVDRYRCIDRATGFAQEGGFFANALDKMHCDARLVSERRGDDQARKSCARSKIDPAFGLRRQTQELERIGDMT